MNSRLCLVIITIIVLTVIGGCVEPNPPAGIAVVTTRNVPTPAPVPWPEIMTFTEETYKIQTKVGEEFAIAMLVSIQGISGGVSYDGKQISEVIYLVDKKYIPYATEIPTGDWGQADGTDWYLFKATKRGRVQLKFDYPLGYWKLFEITVR